MIESVVVSLKGHLKACFLELLSVYLYNMYAIDKTLLR